jgi:uncharacterized protein (DUF2267 family)
MRKTLTSAMIVISALLLFTGMAQANELVNLLMSQLGVTQQQAAGGTGAILNSAKESLKPNEFQQLAATIPEADKLMAAAPKVEAPEQKGMGLGSLTSMAKQVSPELGSKAELAQSFQELGLEKDMIGKFGNVIMDYCKQKGSTIASSLLQKVIGF